LFNLFVEKDTIEINMELIFKEEFYLIKQACITVRKTLGNGFLEKVYENALLIELKRLGLAVVSQKELLVNVFLKENATKLISDNVFPSDKIRKYISLSGTLNTLSTNENEQK